MLLESRQESMCRIWVLEVELNLQDWHFFILLDNFYRVNPYVQSLVVNLEPEEKELSFKALVMLGIGQPNFLLKQGLLSWELLSMMEVSTTQQMASTPSHYGGTKKVKMVFTASSARKLKCSIMKRLSTKIGI